MPINCVSTLDSIIRELDGLISSIITDSITVRSAERKIGLIGLDISINVSPLAIPESAQSDLTTQSKNEGVEPLIDVIEDKNTIRVVAVLPGIRKENVHYAVRDNFLEIEILAKKLYRKNIPCSVRPEQISVKSSTVNNSVLEIVFSKDAKKGIEKTP